MEKNKRLFSFRKHPVGDFPDGEKGRKRKGGRLRRSMGFLMAAALVFNTLPASGLAVSASGREAGLCEHHRSHTADCGYMEAQPCTHEHTEECYTTVTECVHEHTDECYPKTEETEASTGEGNATASDAEDREPENCTHQCSEESGCITKVLDCHHEHDESCGYKEAQECSYVCEICNGTESEDTENSEDAGTDTVECICKELCAEGSINEDCPVCGAEDASLSDCKGKDAEESTETVEENTDLSENTGICRHHREHDAACGYQPASEDNREGSLCTYECRICPVEALIAALPDEVMLDNVGEVRAQLDEILDLYRELSEDEQEQIDLSRCYELQGALDNANAPIPLVNGDVTLTNDNKEIIFTVGECGDNCQGHTIIQNIQGGVVEAAKILVESGTHDITFSGLNLSSAVVGIMPGGTMNLTLDGNNTIMANNNLAGIYVPVGATLVITEESTGSLTVSGNGSAGIGGAWYAPTGETGNFDCGTVVINGGTIAATGHGVCAGIGGAYDDNNQTGGNGGTVTINGGTVTATGGVSSVFGGAGIGGGGATTSREDSGCGGTLTINGGHVTLTAPCSNAYGFGKGYGRNPSGTCSLTLADESYLTLTDGTNLDPNGTYTINGDPTEDMIVVPELVYTGEILDTSEIRIDDSKTGTATYFGQTFQVKASADGWVLQDLGEVREAKEYTATFKKDDKEISKTFTVAQSGTHFVGDGTVKTYKDGAECSEFTADDTITVKATPTATGQAPAKAAARLNGAPTNGQMAVFVGDNQVSGAVNADVDGSYTMEIKAGDVLRMGNVEPNGDAITLTAKFVENDNMADGAGTVDVSISAVAKIENGSATTYVDESGLDAAFTKNSGNSGATITLLKDVERTEYLSIGINCILDLGGHTITCTGGTAVGTFGQTNVTIQGAGEVVSASGTALDVGGNVTLKGGTFTSGGSRCAGVNVNDGDGSLSVTDEKVTIQNTGGGYGLAVSNAQSVQLSGGKYSGTAGAIAIFNSLTLGGMLAHSGDTRYAYFDESGTTPFTGVLSNKSLTGTVTVKACEHTVSEYTPNEGADTHTKTCLACGQTWAEGNCIYGEYTHNDTSHTRICKLCGYQDVKAHKIKCTAEAGGTVIAVSEACKTCGYGKDLGTVTIHIPKLVYGDLTGVVTAETTLTEPVAVAGNVKNPFGSTTIFSVHAIIDPPTMAALTGNVLLSAGTHQIKIEIIIIGDDDNYLADCLLPFTVDPAPLTADMVMLGQTDVTYNGTEQKPALSVKQGESTLTEGTDYEVSYTRDGVVTNDFTSAGTVKITVTGKGNYGGEVEKTFTIKQAESDVGTVTAETLENTLDVSQVVLNRTNQTLAGTLTLTDSILKYGTNTYTWKFTPDNVSYKTVTGEVEVTVNDTIAPTGEISVGTNKWNSFLNTITFGLFFKKTEQVTITAQDNESGVASVSYYISDSELTEEEVKKLDNWTAGNKDKTTFSISKDESCVVYTKITDNQGNVTYISSNGLVFDGTFPVITGITNGGTYCTPQTVTVTDDNLKSVTVNGKEEVLSDNQFTLDMKFDAATIVIAAEDKAGNVTTVTVYAGHNYGTDWKSDSNGHWQECAVCGNKSEVLAHTEDSGTVTKPATQTETGIRTYKCSICSYEMRTAIIEKLPESHTHSYGTEWKSDSNNHWHECDCGAKSDSGTHTEDSGTVTKPATETETGIRTYKCSVCGYKIRTAIIEKLPESHKHSYGTEWKSDSNNHWHECDCGAKSDSAAHTEDSGSVTKPATETETGIRTYKCSVCGYKIRTEIIEKLPESHKHSYGTDWKFDSNNHWHECSCGEKSGTAAHTWDSGTVTEKPTTDKEGEKTFTCTVCGKTKTETVGKLPPSHTHNYGTDWKSDNSNHWHECSCGEKSGTAAHTWDSGTVTVKPTTDKEGEKTFTCTVCGKTKTESVEKLPATHSHSYGTEWKSDNSNHWHECSCGEKSGTAAHTWDSGTVTVKPTTDRKGEKTYICTVCGRTKTETLDKLPPSHKHSYGADWKSDSNSHWHECSCGEKSGTAAHTWDSGTVTVRPTTDKEGEKTYTCTVCGRKKTETVKKLSSDGETGKEDVANNSVKLDSGISLKWKGKALALKWAKVAGAEGYDVFAAQSGKKLNQKSPVKTVKNGKTTVSLTKIAGKKISGKKVYSVKIKAWKYVNGKKIYTGSSRTYHIAGKENRKYTNAKKLKPAKKKYVLKKGRSVRIKVTIIRQSKKKKLPPKSYGPALQYRSGNEKIATVTQGGKVKAKKKGTCYIYVTALNGVRTKIKITVK